MIVTPTAIPDVLLVEPVVHGDHRGFFVETWHDARYAAARGYVDAIVFPENTREMLSLALRATLHNPGPHLGPFVLPPHLGESS